MLEKFFSMFEGKNEEEQNEVIKSLLVADGFKVTPAPGKNGAETIWYEKDGVDNVVAFATNKRGQSLPHILPKDFAKQLYAKNGEFKRYICLGGHSTNSVCGRYKSIGLHIQLFAYYGIEIEEGKQLDHIFGHQGIVLKECLRPVTDKENKYNKPGRKNVDLKEAGEFAYVKEYDFRNSFWIPVLHYVLGVVSYEDMAELRKMELGEVA